MQNIQPLSDYKQLHSIVDQMLGRDGSCPDEPEDPPFSLENPVQHENKTDFNTEFQAVQNGMKYSKNLVHVFYGKDKTELEIAMRKSLFPQLDAIGMKSSREGVIDSTTELIVTNILQTGISKSLIRILSEFYGILYLRHLELEDEKKEFWSAGHRPPNYYARTIALRLARLFARETGTRPTYGSSRDGGHPSTTFSRALEQVFQILKIEAGIRGPAEWAISQIADDDLKPAMHNGPGIFVSGRLGSISGGTLSHYLEIASQKG